jgi:hypothetical protein
LSLKLTMRILLPSSLIIRLYHVRRWR